MNLALLTALGAVVAALPLTLAACGGDDETTTTPTTTTTTEPTGTTGAGGGPSDEDCGASIDKTTGEAAGLEPDQRCGATPPSVEIGGLAEAADAAGCELRLDAPDEGNTHLRPGAKPPDYKTNPPTSGPHDPTPLADGAYRTTPEERYSVHSLEHGRIVVQYEPDLPEDDQLALKGVFDEDPNGMVLIPNPDMPYEVAATAWTNGLGCETYSPEVLDAVRDFRDEFRGKGPEAIPL